MRRVVLLLAFACAALLAAPAALPAKPSPRSWARSEIKLVVSRGLMAPSVASFRPSASLTQGELRDLVAGLTEQPPQAVSNPSSSVTMAQLDARLVRALGFGDEAQIFSDAATAVGLRPPSRFGTEVVARLLGLRMNHPAGQDELERLPSDPAPRAEAAYSAAQILRFSGRETQAVEEAAMSFELPLLTTWQSRILTTAFRFVGFPYVWAGESESRQPQQSPFGAQVTGGFDCSGFAWRVYKLERYPGAPLLGETLRGRTAAEMAGEVPRRRRIKVAQLAPGDLVFFGPRGPRSKPAEIDHMGIYAGNGWIVHSSRYGVALAPLAGWYAEWAAWGRRPLAEAGL